MSDPVETRGPEPADRSPEPADREAAVARATTPDAVWGIEYGWDAAMAAADEREATLKRVEAERDLAVAEAEESEGERCRGVMVRREREREAAREVRALTEALDRMRDLLARLEGFFEERRTESPEKAMLCREVKMALAALPVPVEGPGE